MKRGICFSAVGGKSSRRSNWGRKSMKERRAHEEVRDEMKRKLGAVGREIERSNRSQ